MFKEREIPKEIRVIMIVVAALIDLIEIVLLIFGIGAVADEIIAPAAEFIFFWWFKFYNVSYSKSSAMPFVIINFVISLIPILGAVYPEESAIVWWLLRENKKIFKTQREQERAELKQINEQNQIELQMRAQENIARRIQEEAAEYSSEEDHTELDQKRQRKAPNQEDYSADFESPNTSLKNSYNTPPQSNRDPNTLDLRRKKKAA